MFLCKGEIVGWLCLCILMIVSHDSIFAVEFVIWC